MHACLLHTQSAHNRTQNLCLGIIIIIHHLSFLKKMDDKADKKKEGVSTFAALTSILAVGSVGDLANNVESVGSTQQKLAKLANSTRLISLEFCILTLILPVRY